MRSLLLSLLIAGFASAATADEIDQEFTGPGTDATAQVNEAFPRAQTFTVGASGTLTRIALSLARGGTGLDTDQVTIDVRPTDVPFLGARAFNWLARIVAGEGYPGGIAWYPAHARKLAASARPRRRRRSRVPHLGAGAGRFGVGARRVRRSRCARQAQLFLTGVALSLALPASTTTRKRTSSQPNFAFRAARCFSTS